MIVWGIDARKVKENHTVSSAPIANLTNFIMRLHELSGEATSPVIRGVLHEVIMTKDDSGYAATFVPEVTTALTCQSLVKTNIINETQIDLLSWNILI